VLGRTIPGSEPTPNTQHLRPNTQDPDTARRYNIRVTDTSPRDDHKHHRHAVYASETTGLLLIALLLLVLTLVRYWHDIHWSLR
jgi:hypothetical protein